MIVTLLHVDRSSNSLLSARGGECLREQLLLGVEVVSVTLRVELDPNQSQNSRKTAANQGLDQEKTKRKSHLIDQEVQVRSCIVLHKLCCIMSSPQ